MKKRIARRAAFTMVEVVVASAVLCVGLLGLVSAIFSMLRLDESARQEDLATRGGREAMERIVTKPPRLAVLENGRVFDVEGLSAPRGDRDGRVGRVEVVKLAPDRVRVAVVVEWRGAAGDSKLRLDTLVTRRN